MPHRVMNLRHCWGGKSVLEASIAGPIAYHYQQDVVGIFVLFSLVAFGLTLCQLAVELAE